MPNADFELDEQCQRLQILIVSQARTTNVGVEPGENIAKCCIMLGPAKHAKCHGPALEAHALQRLDWLLSSTFGAPLAEGRGGRREREEESYRRATGGELQGHRRCGLKTSV